MTKRSGIIRSSVIISHLVGYDAMATVARVAPRRRSIPLLPPPRCDLSGNSY